MTDVSKEAERKARARDHGWRHWVEVAQSMTLSNAEQASPLLLKKKPMWIQWIVAVAVFGAFSAAFIYNLHDLYANCTEANGCIQCALAVKPQPGATCSKLAQPDIVVTGSCASYSLPNNYDKIIEIMDLSKTFVEGLPEPCNITTYAERDTCEEKDPDSVHSTCEAACEAAGGEWKNNTGVTRVFKNHYKDHGEIKKALRFNAQGQMIDPDPMHVRNLLKKKYFGISSLYTQPAFVDKASDKAMIQAGIKILFSYLSIASVLYSAHGPVATLFNFAATIGNEDLDIEDLMNAPKGSCDGSGESAWSSDGNVCREVSESRLTINTTCINTKDDKAVNCVWNKEGVEQKYLSIKKFQSYMLHLPIPSWNDAKFCSAINEHVATALSGDPTKAEELTADPMSVMSDIFKDAGVDANNYISGTADFTAETADFYEQGLGQLPLYMPANYLQDTDKLTFTCDGSELKLDHAKRLPGSTHGTATNPAGKLEAAKSTVIFTCDNATSSNVKEKATFTCLGLTGRFGPAVFANNAVTKCPEVAQEKYYHDGSGGGSDISLPPVKVEFNEEMCKEIQIPLKTMMPGVVINSNHPMEFMYQEDSGTKFRHCPNSVHAAPSTLEGTIYDCCSELTDSQKLATVNAFAGFIMLVVGFGSAVVFMPWTSPDELAHVLGELGPQNLGQAKSVSANVITSL